MANEATAKKIAKALAETEEIPLAQIARVIELLGEEKSLSLLADTLKIEKQGGMALPDGSRRRSPGGVYFLLARQMMQPEDAKRIFADRKSKVKKVSEDAPPIRPRPRVVDVVPARTPVRNDAIAPPDEMGRERARLKILEAVADLSPPDRYKVVRDVLGELGTQLRNLENPPAERPQPSEGESKRTSQRGGRRRD